MTVEPESGLDPPRQLLISGPGLADLLHQAEGVYPREACGLLLGSVEGEVLRVRRILPAANEDAEDPNHGYAIGREVYERAERQAEAAGLRVLGVFHSHPDAPPEPSARDAASAFPGWVYWITPLYEGRPGQPRAWWRDEDAEAWREVPILTG